MTRKQVAFDLDTNALKVYYPTENWRYAYEVIGAHMNKNGFLRQQGSVYISEQPMLERDVSFILRKLVNENPWLNVCMRDCTQADIGEEFSQNRLFDKSAKIPTREELKAQAQAKAEPKKFSMTEARAEIENRKKASQGIVRSKPLRGKGKENER